MTETCARHCQDNGWEILNQAYADTDAGVCTTFAKNSPRGLRFEFTSASENGSPWGAPVPSLNDNLLRWIKAGTGFSRSELEQEQAVMYEELDSLRRDVLRGHYFGWAAR